VKKCFKKGDQKTFQRKVTEQDTARFDSGQVHPVYATFALARDAEWTCRLFVLEMKEDNEEGIGTMISVEHKRPALIGETVQFTATVEYIQKREIVCQFKARVGNRLVAEGRQGQKILKKEKIRQLFKHLEKQR
jgi:predicted thioesterase